MYQLRPYQQNAVEATIGHFKQSRDPAVIVLPTGAGKSIVIAELAKKAKGRVLILAHVKELVEQNHQKYQSFGLEADIYSAGLGEKHFSKKVVFGSIQSVARAPLESFLGFTLLIIDECHRVNMEDESQYRSVIEALKKNNKDLCILGLTATPYRMGFGWIYEISDKNEIKTQESRFFKKCVFELPLSYMIQNKFLTPPIKINIPVTCYDFSELTEKNKMYTTAEVEELLKKQKRLTPLIIKNIIDITESYNRKGVMIFASTINHAKEIMSYLPEKESRLIIGDTEDELRDSTIAEFKEFKFKYLVNVSVLTTGFDAPHVDVIALLRPTESTALYQQIIGRGLRLSPGKQDCLILDYAGVGHDIYTPEIGEKKPKEESVAVLVPCPKCGFENYFWGIMNDDGDIMEHFGRKCRGQIEDTKTQEWIPCGFRFRFKLCPSCEEENDIGARECQQCHATMVDADTKLKQAKLSKNAHVLRSDNIEYFERSDKNGNSYLEIRYLDFDAKYLSEFHFLNNETGRKKFHVNFLRSHLKRPELDFPLFSPDQVIKYKKLFRAPTFVIARKQEKFWRITEKIFAEELI